jgi:hypothetical protein
MDLFNASFLYGPGSSAGIATDYGLHGPGIEARWGRDFPPVQTGPGNHPASCAIGTASFPGEKCGRSVLLNTHPLLAPRYWKSRAIPLPTLWATTGPVTGLLYLTFFSNYVSPNNSIFLRRLRYLSQKTKFSSKLTTAVGCNIGIL